eukprot:TRINITY_DN31589_c0_g1_i1.p1 TRINITY_DN31589_c0_g1~~TRINITY_DN31589_c0_g1_i1.p1  ORF type:complete len:288 (+),score=41.52 TRINITY_DN31589_c0_g1_i1:38-901(+)
MTTLFNVLAAWLLLTRNAYRMRESDTQEEEKQRKKELSSIELYQTAAFNVSGGKTEADTSPSTHGEHLTDSLTGSEADELSRSGSSALAGHPTTRSDAESNTLDELLDEQPLRGEDQVSGSPSSSRIWHANDTLAVDGETSARELPQKQGRSRGERGSEEERNSSLGAGHDDATNAASAAEDIFVRQLPTDDSSTRKRYILESLVSELTPSVHSSQDIVAHRNDLLYGYVRRRGLTIAKVLVVSLILFSVGVCYATSDYLVENVFKRHGIGRRHYGRRMRNDHFVMN